MPVSRKDQWKRIAATLSLPALMVGMTSVSGCRGDGTERPSLSAMSPARWFARQPESADDDFILKPIPGGGDEPPPAPPSARAGRAFVPAPAPAPDAFYGVRPTSEETATPAKPTFGEKLHDFFQRDSQGDSEEIQQISGDDFAPVRSQVAPRSLPPTSIPPVPPPLSTGPVNVAASPFATQSPVTIGSHVEPVQADRRPGRLPTIVARQFPLPPSSEPSPWPYGPAARPTVASEPRRIEPARFSRERAAFLPLPGSDAPSDRSLPVQ
jgi:hypothetical protein